MSRARRTSCRSTRGRRGVDARTYFFTGAETRETRAEIKKTKTSRAISASPRMRSCATQLARDPSVAASRAGDLRLRWVGDSASGPARGVSVRTIESERYAVVDMDTGKTVEEIEASKAFWSVHPGAVYLNQRAHVPGEGAGRRSARAARVRRADVKYFTRSVDTTRLTLVDNSGSKAAYPDRPAYLPAGSLRREKRHASSAQTAACEVVIQFTGFKKVHQGTGAFFDGFSFARDLRVELLPVTFRTVASWVRIRSPRGSSRGTRTSTSTKPHTPRRTRSPTRSRFCCSPATPTSPPSASRRRPACTRRSACFCTTSTPAASGSRAAPRPCSWSS